MSYSIVGLLALVIHFIINRDVLWKDSGLPAQKQYCGFLYSVSMFYLTDALWGIFAELKIHTVIFVNTELFFAAMTASLLLWIRFVVGYLEDGRLLGRMLLGMGAAFFAFEIIVLAVNLFSPVMFRFDENGEYHEEIARDITLIIQLIMFLLTAVYSLLKSHGSKTEVRTRYRAISAFGIAMVALIAAQLFFPLLPLYSMGYVIGTCLIRSYVVEDEKEAYRRRLDASLALENRQKEELVTAKRLVYTDSLTGVKSRQAYYEEEEEKDRQIAEGTAEPFGLAVFDVNALKHINDTLGHDTGDLYIKNACRIICGFFKNSTVYRIGGDEFTVVLEGEDYRDREALLSAFERKIDENRRSGGVTVASGLAVFDPEVDRSSRMVFARADKNMYKRKKEMKLSATVG